MRERPVLVVGFVTPVLMALTGAEPDGSVVLRDGPRWIGVVSWTPSRSRDAPR